MASSLEDLRILKAAEMIADDVWKATLRWEKYAKNVMGQQLCRAVDSIGANIAEAFGRYHYGEKIRFLYYARGSLFETKFWLNRAYSRQLISSEANNDYVNRLNNFGRQLNGFVNQLKSQQRNKNSTENNLREPGARYVIPEFQPDEEFLNQEAQSWLTQPPKTDRQSPAADSQPPISNL